MIKVSHFVQLKDKLSKDVQVAIDRIDAAVTATGNGDIDWSTSKDGKDGKDGVDGKDGKDGKNGKDGARGKEGPRGRDGAAGATGAVGATGLPGERGRDGAMGMPGADGKDGENGLQGVSVVDADIAFDNHLVMTLSDGSEIDCGDLMSESVIQNITSSTTVNTGGGGGGGGDIADGTATDNTLRWAGSAWVETGTLSVSATDVTINGTLLSPGAGTDSFRAGVDAGVTAQGDNAVAVGNSAGQTTQGNNSVAVGPNAARINQGDTAVAVGVQAAKTDQGNSAVAVGYNAGNLTQGNNATAVGKAAGQTGQGGSSVAVGSESGKTDQAANSVAVGNSAGKTTQAGGAVAVGLLAGSATQSANAVAVGNQAGQTTQGADAVAMGRSAGYNAQGANSVAVGYNAGSVTQGVASAAMGLSAGLTNQGTNSVAVGTEAGKTDQGDFSVAVGRDAGETTQGDNSVAVGKAAGQTSQGTNATAVGREAGLTTQGDNSVAVGYNSGKTTQGTNTVALGNAAGQTTQGNNAVSVGYAAGRDAQGTSSVAIGREAGKTNQGNKGIIINATGAALDDTTDGHIHIASDDGSLDFTSAAGWSMSGDLEVTGTVTANGVELGAAGSQGPKGDTGDTGPQGIQGIQGIQGDAGADGSDGAAGPKGDKGDTGDQGIQGIQGDAGADGADGTNGTNGSDGADGEGVPTGGTTGQVLKKSSATNYDTEWADESGGGGGASFTFFDSYLGASDNIALVAYGDSNMNGALGDLPEFWQLKEVSNVYVWQPDIEDEDPQGQNGASYPTDPDTFSWKQMGVDFNLLDALQTLRPTTAVGCILGGSVADPLVPRQNIGLAMAVAIAERNPDRDVYLYEASSPGLTTDNYISDSIGTGTTGDGYDVLNDSTYGLTAAFTAMPGFDESERKVDAVIHCNGTNDSAKFDTNQADGCDGQTFVNNIKQTREVDFPILDSQLFFHTEPIIPNPNAESGIGGNVYYQADWTGMQDLVAQSGSRDYIVTPNQLPGDAWQGTGDYAHYSGDALGYMGFSAGATACQGPQVRPDRIRPTDFVADTDNLAKRRYGAGGQWARMFTEFQNVPTDFSTNVSGESYGNEPVGCFFDGVGNPRVEDLSGTFMRGACQMNTGTSSSGLAQIFLRGGNYLFTSDVTARICMKAAPRLPTDNASQQYTMKAGWIRQEFNDAHVAFVAKYDEDNWIASYEGSSGTTEVDTGVPVLIWANAFSPFPPVLEIQYSPQTEDFTFFIDGVQKATIAGSAETAGALTDFGVSINKTVGNSEAQVVVEAMYAEVKNPGGWGMEHIINKPTPS